MKKILGVFIMIIASSIHGMSNEPDSVYLFSYATEKNYNHDGLHFLWSSDQKNWQSIGNEYSFLRSDYGRWGSEKRMITPYLFQAANGKWHCIWSLNERDKVFAHASSVDLINWGRQSYPTVNTSSNVLHPVVQYDKKTEVFQIGYQDSKGNNYSISTKDFRSFINDNSGVIEGKTITLDLPSGKLSGQVHRVSWKLVDNMIRTAELQILRNRLYAESAKDDQQRFASLKPVTANITIMPLNAKPISDKLMGIFFEDINYAADGGLYAELIQNRDFEYHPSDKEYHDKHWTATHSWSIKGEGLSFTIDSGNSIHSNNPHYAVIEASRPGGALMNAGYGGIPVQKGHTYQLAIFSKQLDKKLKSFRVKLVSKDGVVLTESTINAGTQWKRSTVILTAVATANDAHLEIIPMQAGRAAIDMISLFPVKTFKGRANGLRADLAQVVAELNPRFVRFPGGCVAHGDGLNNIYQWKNTIGPLEARKPQRNLWGYHQSVGLGYYEYFQFCEDIGAAPLPVIAAAVPCQNSGTGGAGQQGGIPMEDMNTYIQDILDLIEWANGSPSTKWGKLRAAAGHPKPFNLKYIGIGNEDLITDVFEERFTMIYNAVRAKHPEITIIGTVGPFYKGTDYDEGWKIADKLQIPMVDEHYYETPGWFINNQDFYDRYDRNKSKVYLGEYASRGNTLYNALAEAVYLTSLERNGDIVHMSSYAPLLAKEGHTQWNPDLIYFNNTEVKPTVNYQVQKLFGQYSGTNYLPAVGKLSNEEEAVKKRIAWSVVENPQTKEMVIKLVNILPVSVKVQVNGLNIPAQPARSIVLKGKPEERSGTTEEIQVGVADNFTTELPPYSLMVIPVKK